MTANVGRTHPKYLQFYLDDSGGTLTDLSAHLDSPGTFGIKFEEQNVRGFSDAIQNIVKGWPEAPMKLVFQWDTVLIAHLTAIVNGNTPLSFDFRMGVRHAWESGEPTFGITSSSTSGILLTEFTTDGIKVNASFNVFGPTAPGWLFAAHT